MLRYPYLSMGAAAALLVVAVFALRFVPNIFFPPSERALVGGELRLPAGTQIEYTQQVVSSFERYIQDELMADSANAGIVNWASFIGAGAPRYVLTYNPEARTPDYAYILINTTDRKTVDALIPRLEQFAAQQWPDLTAKFRPAQLGPPVDTPIEVRLSGSDPERLFRLVDAVKEQVASIPGTRNVIDDWGRRTKKLYVSVNQPRARRAGVSSRDVAISLQTVLSGFETTQYREGETAIPIVMRSVAADREDLGKIESLNIFAQATGASVPLKQVADVEILWEPSKIVRRNRVKSVTVKADLAPGVTATDVNSQLIPWLQQQQLEWPLGYRYEIGGEAEASGKSQASIAAKLPIAALIIVFLLVAQFNSIRRPLIILSTIPLGVIGVVIGLLLARSYFGFMTLLGIISLAGIVINNAIVLLDRVRIEIDQCGLDPARAVIEAAQKRLRPILLTTATTVGGLLPLWFGGGPMFEPMAIAIIFGLLFATLLTLGFVPVAYSILFKVSFKDSVTGTPDQRDAVERHARMSMSKSLGLAEP